MMLQASSAEGRTGCWPRPSWWPPGTPWSRAMRRSSSGGSGAVRYRAILEEGLGARGRFVEVPGPSADAVAAHAIQRFKRGDVEDLSKAVPAYGRAPDITKPKRSGP